MVGEATKIVPGKTWVLLLGLINPAFSKSEFLNLLFTLTHLSDSKNDGGEPLHDPKPSLTLYVAFEFHVRLNPKANAMPNPGCQ